MKNISRWTGRGCSCRTIQRFFASPHDWLQMNLLLLGTVVISIPDSNRYILAVDEVVEKKAGKWTWRVDWFYSSIAGGAIRSVSNHVISLVVDTKKEKSFVLTHQQTTKEHTKSKKSKKQKRAEKREGAKKIKAACSAEKQKGGRPKGSKTSGL